MRAVNRPGLARAVQGLLVGLAAITVLLGGGVADQDAGEAESIGVARPMGGTGPDGTDIQHNETLVRDQV